MLIRKFTLLFVITCTHTAAVTSVSFTTGSLFLSPNQSNEIAGQTAVERAKS